jgi:hypothetical protein
MPRLFPHPAALAAVLLSAAPALADGPAGRWKLRLPFDDQTVTFLLNFAEADGKWVGDFIGSTAKLQQEPKFTALDVKGDAVTFTLSFSGREFIAFDGRLAKDGKKLSGSYSQFGGPLKLADLYPSKLKKLDDPVELARETVAQVEAGPDLFDAGFAVLAKAADKKVPVEEVRGVADKLGKAAGDYGPRWERSVAVKLAATLAPQAGFADVALAQARRAERMLADDAPVAIQMEVLDTMAGALTRAGKADEAKKYTATVQKLEAKDYADSQKALGFTPEPFKGRKGKGDRVVLFEVFTGSEAGPAAAAELASHGLLRSFQPTEVIVLTYHLPAPLPDPLLSADTMDRLAVYAEMIRTVPVVLVNGKPGPRGGGAAAAAKDRYADYRDVAVEQLDTMAKAKLTLTAAPGEKGTYTAKATVADLEAPGEKVFLRFVLAEEKVRYAGASGVRYHQMVVRGMPGGAKGFPLTKKAAEQTVTVNPAEVREKLNKYLDEFAKTEGEFPRPDRPLALTVLKLVAMIQNDATGEVLQAAQVDLK